MENKLKIVLKVVTALIFVIGIILSIQVINNGDPRNVDSEQLGIVEWNKLIDEHEAKNGKDVPFSYEKTPAELGEEQFEKIDTKIKSTVSTTINFTMFVLYACVIISLLTFFIALFTDFKRFVPFLIGTVVLLIIIGISYALSSDVVPDSLSAKADAKTYKLVGTGILTSFMLTAVAGLSWISGEVIKLFK
jgi:hypothetical protein